MTTTILPNPGLHRGVPEAVYRAWGAMNQSRLKGWSTPAHLKANLDAPAEEPTEAMIVGTAEHLALFDPGQYAARVRVQPCEDRRDKAYKEWLPNQEPGSLIIRPSAAERIAAMARKLRNFKPARLLLDAPGDSEVSMIWKDSTGIECKGRIDRLPENAALPLLDLKTARSASPEGFSTAVFDRDYDLQAAFYVDGYERATGEQRAWAWIVIENEYPFEPAVYDDPNSNWLAIGRIKYRAAMDAIKTGIDTGEWPGFAPRVVELPVPFFVARKYDLSLTQGDAGAFAA